MVQLITSSSEAGLASPVTLRVTDHLTLRKTFEAKAVGHNPGIEGAYSQIILVQASSAGFVALLMSSERQLWSLKLGEYIAINLVTSLSCTEVLLSTFR